MTVVIDRRVAQAAPSAPAVVKVNGTVIARDAIAREIQNHPAGQPIAARQQATRALVVRELLLQEAERMGIAAEPQNDEAGRRETEDEALIRALIAQEVLTLEPEEAECRRFYERHPARFRSPDIYEAAHILFAARQDDPAAFAKAHLQAEAATTELRHGPERFADLAKAHSACPSAAQGGNLGQITADQTTPEFERALFALEPGQICEYPVPTRYGVHVIRLDRKIAGRQLPFELVADRIADYLRDAVARRAAAQYIARLVSRATITGIEIASAEEHRVN
ncbi:MAG: peptidylprolyl isomerase [Xanthobacteraceae bacterium]